jgi:hypothetical protein
MFDRIVLISLAVWALLTGLLAVTNIHVEWSQPICGFAALVLGIVCLIRAFR